MGKQQRVRKSRVSGQGKPAVKEFLTYEQQVELLASRGLDVGDPSDAVRILRRVNYYRLSGYWYPLRAKNRGTTKPLDTFREGASLRLVHQLYSFDESLRVTLFGQLSTIELVMRAMIGHELGRIDPLIHGDANALGATARQFEHGKKSTRHAQWLGNYTRAVRRSKEDFVQHHWATYGGKLPIWAGVELLDWGMLSRLYGMAPNRARRSIAGACNLSAPQLESWLKCMNIQRNYAAHHARMYNRVYDIKPKLSDDPRLDPIREVTERLYGQLTLVQFIHRQLELSDASALPALMESYPENPFVPITHLGFPDAWRHTALWATQH